MEGEKQNKNTKPHLKEPWKPGQSGNPNGRPKKGQTMTDILQKTMDEMAITINGQTVDGKKALAMKLLQLALQKNDFGALKYCYDRIDGMARQQIAIDHGENPMVRILFGEDKMDLSNLEIFTGEKKEE